MSLFGEHINLFRTVVPRGVNEFVIGFGFEIIIPDPDPIRISDLIFRTESDRFVKDRIGFLGTIYSLSCARSDRIDVSVRR